MRYHTAVLGAAAVAAAFGLAGCSAEPERSSGPGPVRPGVSAPALPAAAPLPAPEALTDVLSRLADPAVPGAEKTAAIEKATAADAEALDKFGRALRDGGFHPITFEAADLRWSDADPDHVVATITATGPDPAAGSFSFPMEFTAENTAGADGGWQLTRETADMLLESSPAEPTTPPR